MNWIVLAQGVENAVAAADESGSIMDTLKDPEKLAELGLGLGKSLLAAALIFLIGKWVAGIVTNILRKVMRRAKIDETLVGFFANIAHGLLMVFVVLAALEQLGVDTKGIAAIIAAAGFAIAFALQGSLGNFAAGVMLVFFQPFKVGDKIKAGGAFGDVQEIGLFATTIHTADGKRVIVPNGAITADNITNLTVNGAIRVEMTFGIGYDDDIDQAKAVMMRILEADPRVVADPAPTVAVSGHGDSSVNFACFPWCAATDYWGVWFDTHEAVKKAFDEAGVSIPFPQRDVHMQPTSS